MKLYLKLGALVERTQKLLKINHERVKSKIKIIRDTVTAQQNYAGADTKLEELYVENILEDALKLTQESFIRLGIAVERKYLSRFKVYANRAKLFYVIFNIIANAKEAMSNPSIKEKRLTVSMFEDDTGKYLRIEDTGVGIPENTLNRIFDYGFSAKTGQLGFGLYTCAAYMEDMGGSIQAVSTGEGKGACFVLKFL